MFFSLRKTIEDRLQDSLHKTLEKTKSPLVFGHVCWGVLSEPGAFRMTRIVHTTNARLPLVEFLKRRGVEQQEALRRHIHEEALRRHIMRFERSGILLDWITRWMYDKCEPGTEPRRSLTFSFLVSREHDAPCFGTNDHSLIVSQEFFNTLVHEPIVREYLQALYLPDNPDDTPDVSSGNSGVLRYAADQLIGLRFTARALIEESTHCGSALRRLSGVYIEEGQPACPTQKHQWMFLEALQTGLMYVDAARIDGAAARGFVSFGVCYQVYEDKKPTDNPLAVISFVIPSDVDEGYTSSMREEVKAILEGTLEGAIRSVGLCRDRPQWDRLLQISHARWDPEKIRGTLVKDLTLAFSVKAFPNWAPALTLWLSLITDKLRSSIHEGQPLNFYFVVADRSQVLDSGLFEVIELDFHDERNGLVPWKDDGEIRGDEEVESLLQRIGRYIGKKNYAWFLDGRYALLWDATFPSKYPHNLIRFKESSWDVFINHARIGGRKAKPLISLRRWFLCQQMGPEAF